MLHLIKYNLLVKLKNFGTTFWPLVFPILLGTMFTSPSETLTMQISRRYP